MSMNTVTGMSTSMGGFAGGSSATMDYSMPGASAMET